MTPREKSMARHPAGKGRVNRPLPNPAPIALVTADGSLVPVVRDIATVTVKKAVDGTRRRKARSLSEPKQPVSHVKVDPRVWKRARSILAEGRYSRIEVIDSGTVIVR